MGPDKVDDIDELLYKVNEDIIVTDDYNDRLMAKIDNSKSILDIIIEFIFLQRLSLSFICSGFLLLAIGALGLDFDMMSKIVNFKIMLP